MSLKLIIIGMKSIIQLFYHLLEKIMTICPYFSALTMFSIPFSKASGLNEILSIP